MGDALSYREEDDQGITPPLLSPQQLRAVRRIAAQENGAWARAFFDGTAEAFSAHRGGLRRFAISPDGAERQVNEIPPTTLFRYARLAAILLVAFAAVSAGDLILRASGGEDIGRWWLAPLAYGAVAFLIAAAFFGIHARLPAASPYYGEWVGLPGPSEGDTSGHTMPGFVRAHPLFALWWLPLCVWMGSGSMPQEANTSIPFPSLLGGVAGVVAWWAIMLCFSRGWVKDGED